MVSSAARPRWNSSSYTLFRASAAHWKGFPFVSPVPSSVLTLSSWLHLWDAHLFLFVKLYFCVCPMLASWIPNALCDVGCVVTMNTTRCELSGRTFLARTHISNGPAGEKMRKGGVSYLKWDLAVAAAAAGAVWSQSQKMHYNMIENDIQLTLPLHLASGLFIRAFTLVVASWYLGCEGWGRLRISLS